VPHGLGNGGSNQRLVANLDADVATGREYPNEIRSKTVKGTLRVEGGRFDRVERGRPDFREAFPRYPILQHLGKVIDGVRRQDRDSDGFEPKLRGGQRGIKTSDWRSAP
jgi:hypothetical protein